MQAAQSSGRSTVARTGSEPASGLGEELDALEEPCLALGLDALQELLLDVHEHEDAVRRVDQRMTVGRARRAMLTVVSGARSVAGSRRA